MVNTCNCFTFAFVGVDIHRTLQASSKQLLHASFILFIFIYILLFKLRPEVYSFQQQLFHKLLIMMEMSEQYSSGAVRVQQVTKSWKL